MQIVYQNQLLNVTQWKLTSDAIIFLVELSSAAVYPYFLISRDIIDPFRWAWYLRFQGMIVYDYRLDEPAIREPNLEIDD
jgi:hypothetical protein